MALKTDLSFTPTVSTGRRQQYVTLANPGTPVPDGDGGYTQVWSELSPPDWWVEITTASTRRMERIARGAIIEMASHIVTGPYRADINTKTQITWGTRTLLVGEVFSPDEGNIETVCLCVEVVV